MCFRHAKQDRMIAGLPSLLDNLQPATSIDRGIGEDRQKHFFAHVIRATTGDEHTAGIQELQRAQIEKSAGLLTLKWRHDKPDAVLIDFELIQSAVAVLLCRRTPKHTLSQLQSFNLAHARIVSLQN